MNQKSQSTHLKLWEDRHILILGAARQGLALARYLVEKGAYVTINDLRAVEQMGSIKAELDIPGARHSPEWVLGQGHPLELLDKTELLCLSGGVPLTLPIVKAAVQRGIPLSNDSQIFLESVPCKVIGITGSAGKSTTTTLVGRIFQEAAKLAPGAPHTVWVGGNIGNPLITELDSIQPQDIVVLELSSFQLDLMTASPHIAAILNITPNHLDRHETMENYINAKNNILKYQQEDDVCVLNHEDPITRKLASEARAQLVTFGFNLPSMNNGRVIEPLAFTYLKNDRLMLHEDGKDLVLLRQGDIELRGRHNILNVLSAAAVATAAGIKPVAIHAGVIGFTGLPHRLELVRALRGVKFYNDSIATAPERTIAAMHSFDERLILLLGGRDKNLPWEDLARALFKYRQDSRLKHVFLFGEASGKILETIRSVAAVQLEPGAEDSNPGQQPSIPWVTRLGTLQEAIEEAALAASQGDVVLLSPGGTSFDAFIDFEERGEYFRKCVNQLS